jgi:hypothetical protein
LRVVGAKQAELVTFGDFENDSERGGIRAAAMRSAARLYVVYAIFDPMVHDHAPAGGEDVQIPVHVPTVGAGSSPR